MHCPNSTSPREKNRHTADWFCSDIQRGEGACVIYKPTLASAARLFFRYPPGGPSNKAPSRTSPTAPAATLNSPPATPGRPHHRYNPNTTLPIPHCQYRIAIAPSDSPRTAERNKINIWLRSVPALQHKCIAIDAHLGISASRGLCPSIPGIFGPIIPAAKPDYYFRRALPGLHRCRFGPLCPVRHHLV